MSMSPVFKLIPNNCKLSRLPNQVFFFWFFGLNYLSKLSTDFEQTTKNLKSIRNILSSVEPLVWCTKKFFKAQTFLQWWRTGSREKRAYWPVEAVFCLTTLSQKHCSSHALWYIKIILTAMAGWWDITSTAQPFWVPRRSRSPQHRRNITEPQHSGPLQCGLRWSPQNPWFWRMLKFLTEFTIAFTVMSGALIFNRIELQKFILWIWMKNWIIIGIS